MLKDLPLTANAAILIAAAVAVWLAGARVARYADQIAAQTGLGEGLIGFIMLGVATSTPEIAVGVTASISGTPQLSVNDVLGSASINLVILAVADAVYGQRTPLTSRPGTPQVMLQGALGMLLLALVIGPALSGDVLLLGIGAWSWLIGAVFAGAIWFIARSRHQQSWIPAERKTTGQDDRSPRDDGYSLRQLIIRTAAAVVVILVAGFLLAQTGEAIAEQTGLGASFVGAILIALATSLTEFSTTFTAVKLHRYEMAIAGIFSTNVFNVVIIVLVDAVYRGGPVLVEAGRFAAFAALLALVLTSLFMVGMIERRDRTVLRMGLDSLAVLICYGAAVVVLFQLR